MLGDTLVAGLCCGPQRGPAGGEENLIQIRTFISTNNHHLGFLDTTAHQRAVSNPNLEKINCAISEKRRGGGVRFSFTVSW